MLAVSAEVSEFALRNWLKVIAPSGSVMTE